MMGIKIKARSLIQTIIACFISLLFVIPALAVVMTSLKNDRDAQIISLSPTTDIQWSNFLVAIEKGKLLMAFKNSLINTLGSVIILILITCMAAFVLCRRRDRIGKILYYFILLGMAIPTSNIALMRIMKAIHLMNTRPGIILIYIGINASLSLFLCYGYIKSIPKEIDEAAVIDGCTPAQLFFMIIMPLLKPIVATLFVLMSMSVWNDFAFPIYFLNKSTMWPMTLAVYNFFGMYSQKWNLVCADAVITTVPILIIFILGQKYIVGGLTSGSVKG